MFKDEEIFIDTTKDGTITVTCPIMRPAEFIEINFEIDANKMLEDLSLQAIIERIQEEYGKEKDEICTMLYEEESRREMV